MKAIMRKGICYSAALAITAGSALAGTTIEHEQVSPKRDDAYSSNASTQGGTRDQNLSIAPDAKNRGMARTRDRDEERTRSTAYTTSHHSRESLSATDKRDIGTERCVTVRFNPGDASLSEAQKLRLRELAQFISSRDRIDEITVAAWSDRPMPQDGALPKSDRELAQLRARTIKDFLKDELKVRADVDTYNMSHSAGWMARTFNTDESELKSAFAKRGAAARMTHNEFSLVQSEGGPSRAVVVAEDDIGD